MTSAIPSRGEEISAQWLESVLTKNENKHLSVTRFDCRHGTAPGDNYLSQMLAVDVETVCGKAERKPAMYHLMVKLLPENENFRDVLVKTGAFGEEIKFYSTILPKLNNFLKATGSEISFPAPRCWFAESSHDGSAAAIVMDNLKSQGYVMRDRLKGMDYVDGNLTMKHLAQFHATTYSARLKDPALLMQYRATMDSWHLMDNLDKYPMMKDVAELFKNAAANAVRIIELDLPSEQARKLSAKIQPLLQNIIKIVLALRKEQPHNALLCHRDLWINNIMIGPENRCIFVDWQMHTTSSPIFDLMTFVYTSLKPSVRKSSLETMLMTYYQEFANSCEQFGVSHAPVLGPNREAFIEDFNGNKILGFIVACISLHIAKSESISKKDQANVSISEWSKTVQEEALSDPHKRQDLLNIVLEMDASGVFDVEKRPEAIRKILDN